MHLFKEVAASRYLTAALRLVVGVTLIVAGVGKVPHQQEFIDLVASYHILPEALCEAYGLLLPWAEIAAGVCLVLGLFTRYASALSILMFVSFMVANSVSLARGASSECDCFGQLGPLTEMQNWQALLLDIGFLAMSLQILIQEGEFLSVDSLFTKMGAALQKRRRS